MQNETENRTVSQRAIYRLSYAVALTRGAQKISWGPEQRLESLPGFLLLGFALENAFATLLIAKDHQHPGDYKSHDLVRAMNACARLSPPLVLSAEAAEFVTWLTPWHEKFAFRYPENMSKVSPPSLDRACQITDQIVRDTALVLEMSGFNVQREFEKL